MDPKSKAIIAHITIFGWFIAFLLNQKDKDYYTSFYLRQTLPLMLITMFIPVLKGVIIFSGFLGIAVFVFWLISLINCVNEKVEELPFVGGYFQEWFKSI